MKIPAVLPQNLVMRNHVLYFRARARGKLHWKRSPWQAEAAFSSKGNVLDCVKVSLSQWMGFIRDQADQQEMNPDAVPDGSVLSWDDFVEVYRKAAAAQYAKSRKPAPKTSEDYISRLLFLLSEAKIARSEKMDAARPERIDKWIDGEVSAALDNVKARMKKSGTEGEPTPKMVEEEQDRIRYRLFRTLAMATSCWAKCTDEYFRRHGVRVPECVKRWPSVYAYDKIYQDPPDQLKRATSELGKQLEKDRPGVWLAWAMCYHCGMRPGDMQRAEWGWFREAADGSAILRFVPHKTQRGTRGREVYQNISAALWGRLRAAWAVAGDGGEFVVPGGEEKRVEALADIGKAMRGIGWETEKLAYELRKLFVSAVYNVHGLKMASEYSGDNATTIERYYARAYRRDAPQMDIDLVVSGAK